MSLRIHSPSPAVVPVRTLRHSSVLAFALALQLSASAQTTAEPAHFPLAADEVAGAAPRDPSAEVVTLEPIRISDSKNRDTTLPDRPVTGVYGFATPYQDIPRSIAQITPGQLSNDVINSINDFARYSPATSQLAGQADNAGTPYFRGAQGDLYQNGVRLISRGTVNRPFTLNPYEEADLVAGPASVIFGPSARTAGYVNYITKRPHFDSAKGSVTLKAGRWYADGAGFEPQYTAQVDFGAPIIRGKLAYRISYEGSSNDSFYQNTKNRYNNVFAALGWRPNSTTALDFNLEYGHYNWILNNFQNRVTNQLIRDGIYLAGPATPIIQVGSSYYSPILSATGTPSGDWITRTRVVGSNGLTYFNAGTSVTNPTSNTTAGAGTIVGYVLDPSLVKPTSLDGSAALNAPGFPSVTKNYNIQTRLKKVVTPWLTIVNNFIFGRYESDSSSNGGFNTYIKADSLEDRIEFQTKSTFQLGRLPVEHNASTGYAYREEPNTNYKDTQAPGYGSTGDQFDLTGDPYGWTRNAYFGANVQPFSGLVTDPVLTRFGYLKGFWQYLVVPESPQGVSVTSGGSQSGTPAGSLGSATYTTVQQWDSVFSQHSFKIGSQLIWDVGARASLTRARLSNPLPSPNVPGNADLSGSIRESQPSVSSSLSYKPFAWLTTYATYNRVTASNGNTSGGVGWSTPVTGPNAGKPNQLDPFNFKSLSELREIGAKAELIPDKLVGTLAVFRQTRALTLALPAGAAVGADPIQAIGLFEGIEVGLRLHSSRNFSAGLNFNHLVATNQNATYSAPAPLVADNATNIQGATTALRGVNYRAVNLPSYTANAYASYQFDSGWGARADLSFHSDYFVTTNGAVTVPSEYTLNAGIFYNQPRYRASLELGNVTNQRTHAGGSTTLPPFNVSARYTYRF